MYPCSQLELYTAATLIWSSCSQHLTNFEDFKSKYRPSLIAQEQADIQRAKALPDYQARNEATETLGIQLAEKAATVRNEWQKLKRYIEEAWPENLQKPKLEAAGQTLYKKAGADNWPSVLGLSTAGENFIRENLATLINDGYMPDAFPTRFFESAHAFSENYQQFLDSKENESIGAAAKVKANNTVYKNVIALCKDGQEIFKSNEAVRSQFVFEEALLKIGGVGTAGVRGLVTRSDSALPLAGVAVTLSGSDKTGLTDNEGRYEIKPLAAGTYALTFSKEGFASATVAGHEVKIGTLGRADAGLVPAG